MATPSEWRQKAFDFAAESSKQLITVATAVIAVTVTFSEDIIEDPNEAQTILLSSALFVYLVSVMLGLLALMAMASELSKAETDADPLPSIYSDRIPQYVMYQSILFLLATLGIVVFGAWALWSQT